MTIIINTPITFDGYIQANKGEIGFTDNGGFVVGLEDITPNDSFKGCGYVTVLPISSMEYRRKFPTGTYVKDFGDFIVIADDGGNESSIKANVEVLNYLIAECVGHEIPLKD